MKWPREWRCAHKVHLFARRAEEIDLIRNQMAQDAWAPLAGVARLHELLCPRQFAISRRSFDIVHSIGINAIGRKCDHYPKHPTGQIQGVFATIGTTAAFPLPASLVADFI